MFILYLRCTVNPRSIDTYWPEANVFESSTVIFKMLKNKVKIIIALSAPRVKNWGDGMYTAKNSPIVKWSKIGGGGQMYRAKLSPIEKCIEK